MVVINICDRVAIVMRVTSAANNIIFMVVDRRQYRADCERGWREQHGGLAVMRRPMAIIARVAVVVVVVANLLLV